MRTETMKQHWAIRATGWTWRVILVLTIGILLLCQGWEYANKVTLPWGNALCLLVGAAGGVLLLGLAWVITRHSQNPGRRKALMGVLCLALSFGIFYVSAHYAHTGGWDPAVVYQDAIAIGQGFTEDVNNWYFGMYANNVFLTIVFSWIFSLGEPLGLLNREYFILHAIQSLGYGWVLWMTYLSAEKLNGDEKPWLSLWSWMLALLLIGISPWVAVQYTDSAALILGATQIWVFLRCREEKRRPLWLGVFGLLSAIAYKIKPQTLILVIAVVLMTLLVEPEKWFRKEALKRALTSALAFGVCMGIGLGAVKIIVDRSPYDLNPEAQMGITHYLKMGLNPETMGGYNAEDMGESAVIGSSAERSRADWETAMERARAMGPGGLLAHAVRKTMTNYSDGTFGWEQEGDFYAYDTYYFEGSSPWFYEHIPPFYIGADYPDMVDGSFSHVWRTIVQCAWLAVLLFGAFSFSKTSDHRVAVLQLAILGLTLFQLLFEARARYLFAYAPAYILLAGTGLGNLIAWIRKRWGKEPAEA